MLEILEFIFSSAWHYIGVTIWILILAEAIALTNNKKEKSQ